MKVGDLVRNSRGYTGIVMKELNPSDHPFILVATPQGRKYCNPKDLELLNESR